MYTLVTCPSLTGTSGRDDVNCSLEDDGVPSYGDTCSINCPAGYELTGNDTRICQSDGSWSGIDNVCRKSKHHINNIMHNKVHT